MDQHQHLYFLSRTGLRRRDDLHRHPQPGPDQHRGQPAQRRPAVELQHRHTAPGLHPAQHRDRLAAGCQSGADLQPAHGSGQHGRSLHAGWPQRQPGRRAGLLERRQHRFHLHPGRPAGAPDRLQPQPGRIGAGPQRHAPGRTADHPGDDRLAAGGCQHRAGPRRHTAQRVWRRLHRLQRPYPDQRSAGPGQNRACRRQLRLLLG